MLKYLSPSFILFFSFYRHHNNGHKNKNIIVFIFIFIFIKQCKQINHPLHHVPRSPLRSPLHSLSLLPNNRNKTAINHREKYCNPSEL